MLLSYSFSNMKIYINTVNRVSKQYGDVSSAPYTANYFKGNPYLGYVSVAQTFPNPGCRVSRKIYTVVVSSAAPIHMGR